MFVQQPIEIQPDDSAVNHAPIAADHHAVGPVGAAQYERSQRISRAGKTRIVQTEKRK